jgi:hypothetical protein
MTWQPIESAPKDGRKVWVKRVYEGRIVKEGWAVFDVASDDAPIRFSDALIPADHEYADTPRWRVEGRRFSFPTPTHWMAPPAPDDAGKE